jgi:putative peptide zinc metalloprotease protein
MAQVRPTFSESWYRVADLRARLRPSAQISRQFYRGDRWYVVRDPAGNQFHRLSAPAYRFVGLLDGTRTVAEAWDLVGGQLADDAPTQNEVIQILSQLHAANLLESNVTPDAAVLLRRHKKMVKQQWQGRLMNILFPRIPLWDPDSFLVRWMPVVRPFLGKFGALLWLGMIFSAIAALAPEWKQLEAQIPRAIAPGNWPFLWATFCLIKLIHELGHAFSCRRFGGECHELGLMFLVLVPAPYVDASSAWSFPNKWARVFVGAGGMIIELFVASILAWVWVFTAKGSLINGLALNAMLIASFSTIIFNANPLLRYDGYYILSDLLEIPNLRYRSTEYATGLIKRHLFKVKLSQPLPPVGQRIWLVLYAISSSIYRMFVGIMIILMVWNQVPVLGVLMALGGVITWLAVPIVKTARYLLIEPELHRKRFRATAWVLGAVAAAVFLVGFVPSPVGTHFQAEAIVEPMHKNVIYTLGPGLVEEVAARDGQLLKQGDVIMKLRDRSLESDIAQTRARIAAAKARKESAFNDPPLARIAAEEERALNSDLNTLQGKLEELTIKAPLDGVLIAPELKHMAGRYVPAHMEVATVATTGDLRLAAVVDQEDAALTYLHFGDKAQVRLASQVWQTDQGVLEARTPTPIYELPHPALGDHAGGKAPVDPTDQEGKKLMRPQIGLWVTLKNDGTYLPGQRAYLRFTLENKPLYWQWKRWVEQLIQSRSSNKWI